MSRNKGVVQQRGHGVMHSSCLSSLLILVWPPLAASMSEPDRGFSSRQISRWSGLKARHTWRSMGCSSRAVTLHRWSKGQLQTETKAWEGGTPRGRAALWLFPAVEADSDPVSPDAAPPSSTHNESGLSQRGLFQQRNGNIFMWRFTQGAYKRRRRRERNPNASKQLNHPVDILGLYRGVGGGGVFAVVFCTTDSQCRHGRLLSLELCTLPRITNLVHNWQMQGV